MASIKRSKGKPRASKPKRRKALRGKAFGKHRTGILLDVRDELDDLRIILDCVPELRAFCRTMGDIVRDDGDASKGRWIPAPPSAGMTGAAGTTDHINRAAIALTGKPLRDGAARPFLDADLVDLGNAADTIIAAVRLRLDRTGRLLAILGGHG